VPRFVASLRAQDGFAKEVVVVDNGSTDDTPTVVRREFPRLWTSCAQRTNLGFAKANNLGGCPDARRVSCCC